MHVKFLRIKQLTAFTTAASLFFRAFQVNIWPEMFLSGIAGVPFPSPGGCDYSILRFGRYVLQFHLSPDWLQSNKHSRNFLWCSGFKGKSSLGWENTCLSVCSRVAAEANERRLYSQARKDCKPPYKTCISKACSTLQFKQENSPSIPTHTLQAEPLF